MGPCRSWVLIGFERQGGGKHPQFFKTCKGKDRAASNPGCRPRSFYRRAPSSQRGFHGCQGFPPMKRGTHGNIRPRSTPFSGLPAPRPFALWPKWQASQRRREDFIGHSLVRQGAAQSSRPFLSVQARHRKRYRACTLKRPYANRKHFYVPLSSEASGGISPYFLRRLSTNLSSVWVTALR